MARKRYRPRAAKMLLKKKRKEVGQKPFEWAGLLPFGIFFYGAIMAPLWLKGNAAWMVPLGIYLVMGSLAGYLYYASRVGADRPGYLWTIRVAVRPSRYTLLLQTKGDEDSEGWQFAEIYRQARQMGGPRRALDVLLKLCDEATILYINAFSAGIAGSEATKERLAYRQEKALELAALIEQSERARIARGEPPHGKILEGRIHQESQEINQIRLEEARTQEALGEAELDLVHDRKMLELGGDPELEALMQTLRDEAQR